MAPTLIDLRPDRRLLDHEFEGYKLNLQALPHFSFELATRVDRVFPDEIQYSFIHAKLFALHNHLIPDQWDYTHSYFYIDRKQQVRHLSFESENHRFQETVVYDIPAHVERKSGHFNLCLSFPSSTLAVVSDGTGYLHIVDTQARNRINCHSQQWQTLHSSLILGQDKYFIIVDSKIQEKNDAEILHCLLQSVEQNESHFNSVLTWVTFESEEKTWRQTSFRQLQGKGIMHYAAIETACNALYIVSDHPFKFTADSEKDVNEEQEKKRTILYTWLQTTEDITVTLKFQENFNKKLLHIDVKPSDIRISYGDTNFLNGKLFRAVDSELTTWSIQDNGQVNILITKSESMLWNELIEGGDENGEQIMDENLVEEAHKRLAHLCSETEVVGVDQAVPGLSTQELEECDAASEEDTVLARLDIDHETTHRVSLSVHQFLFSIHIEPQETPAIVLRHDVDACIWQPYSRLINSDSCLLLHQGTLNAFGYVQSSKQNKKFLTCPPNFSYSVVSESSRHIFLYQNKGNLECQLRKRSGGMVRNIKIGQQNVFNVERYGEVLGIDATNDYLFVLTGSTIVAIGIQ
ncbi:nudC domain-containing protein 1 [Choristoneura fumiferana]|uniref:nudC domain-containing protein 1 n=1 Tax=Choristoneura fumiferana TaxID=7141 RepID=UPI003D156E92